MLVFKVRKTIEKYQMLQKGDRVLVGVSGGPDSIALLHILSQLRDEYELNLYVAHLNHLIRPDAESDAEYVRQFALKLGAAFVMERCDVRQLGKRLGVGEEVAGRMARYGFFYRAAKENGCTRIALGHNMDDQAETVLMRLIRGAGTEGLGGIPPVRGKIVRPLIETPRSDIEAYCRSWNLDTRLDITNLEEVYFRNRIRRQLIPLLQSEYNPNISRILARTAELMREENAYMSAIARKKYFEIAVEATGSVVLPANALAQLELPIRRRVVRFAVSRAGGPPFLDFHHVSEILAALEKEGRKWRLMLPGKSCVWRDGDELIFSGIGFAHVSKAEEPLAVRLEIPGTTKIPWANCTISAIIVPREALGNQPLENELARVAYLDYNSLEMPLVARARRKGDRMQPLGMSGSKKLGDIFREKKTESESRDRVPIITTASGKIVWVVEHTLDDRFKVLPSTTEVLVLECIKGGGT
ncbi:MAG TPA: tRNA lysidine(34) synthetase TilS [Firmicutes bacterium]|nr:tRNA lysidine(34) synthetase TilS [Bacillota bacterium]